MQVYFAPLEGVTDSIYRRAHHAMFGGVEKYFIPFISPSESLTFSSREQRAIDPRENAGVPVVPQLLTRDADRFAAMTKLLSDCGYREVNLNLGCPSGTVTAKGKGSGMLRDLGALRAFLDAIFASSALPISIKTRIGYQSIDEWGALARASECVSGERNDRSYAHEGGILSRTRASRAMRRDDGNAARAVRL